MNALTIVETELKYRYRVVGSRAILVDRFDSDVEFVPLGRNVLRHIKIKINAEKFWHNLAN